MIIISGNGGQSEAIKGYEVYQSISSLSFSHLSIGLEYGQLVCCVSSG